MYSRKEHARRLKRNDLTHIIILFSQQVQNQEVRRRKEMFYLPIQVAYDNWVHHDCKNSYNFGTSSIC